MALPSADSRRRRNPPRAPRLSPRYLSDAASHSRSGSPSSSSSSSSSSPSSSPPCAPPPAAASPRQPLLRLEPAPSELAPSACCFSSASRPAQRAPLPPASPARRPHRRPSRSRCPGRSSSTGRAGGTSALPRSRKPPSPPKPRRAAAATGRAGCQCATPSSVGSPRGPRPAPGFCVAPKAAWGHAGLPPPMYEARASPRTAASPGRTARPCLACRCAAQRRPALDHHRGCRRQKVLQQRLQRERAARAVLLKTSARPCCRRGTPAARRATPAAGPSSRSPSTRSPTRAASWKGTPRPNLHALLLQELAKLVEVGESFGDGPFESSSKQPIW